MTILDLRRASDDESGTSLANKFRNKRFALFASLVGRLPMPIQILDIGGTLSYWQQRGWVGKDGVHITVVNLNVPEMESENVVVKSGNALDLSEYADRSFDVVHSNSVIEHLHTFANQERMAAEIQRVGKSYWVQTPNYWFPIEPHFHVPGWQWLPRQVRVALLMRFRCGWNGPVAERARAETIVDDVRLMTRAELERLFPMADIWNEPFFGLTKSLVAYQGFGVTL